MKLLKVLQPKNFFTMLMDINQYEKVMFFL